MLYLIRHGQTDWNAEGRIQGSIDRPLNEMGRGQALQVGELLSKESISAIYSSCLMRAKETASIIATYLSCPLYQEIDLREAHFGSVVEGMHILDYREQFKEQIEMRKQLSLELKLQYKIVPDAESTLDVLERVAPILKQIAKRHDNEKVLIVTHGGVIKSFLIHFTGSDQHEVDNGFILRVCVKNGELHEDHSSRIGC